MRRETRNIIRLTLFLGFISCFAVSEAQNVMQKLQSNRQTSHFARALVDANLHEKLNQNGPFTLFAPSNSAFDKLSIGQKNNDDLLLNHIFTGMATERSLKAMSEVTCLSGRTINIKTNSNDQVMVNSVPISTANIRTSNGVIHIIDGVIK